MSANPMPPGLLLVALLAQPVMAQGGESPVERRQQGSTARISALDVQEEPDSTPPAVEPEEPPLPDEAEPGEQGQTSAGASLSSSGGGVGVTSRRDRFFFGGGLGLGFGDITFVEISPLVGYNFTSTVRGGLSLIYRYRKDERFADSRSTTDYGGSVFVDYFPLERIFLRGEYEYLSYEFIYSDLSTGREGYSSIFGGVGFANPIGPNGSFNVMLLYNFSHDADDPFSPYADPYVFRVGVGFGF